MTQSSHWRFEREQANSNLKLSISILQLVIILILFSVCTGSDETAADEEPVDPVEQMFAQLDGSCDYPILAKHRNNPAISCRLEVLSLRCNDIDECLVYCVGNDVGENIGGGCAHLCNYRNRQYWRPPKIMEQCPALPSEVD